LIDVLKMKNTRTAIVTGGSAGIGLAVARAFLEKGHNVYICGRQELQLNKAIYSLTEEFGNKKISGSVCDVRSLAAVSEMVELAAQHFGRIDTLINNAGISFITQFEEITPDMWADIIDTNLTGVFNCCHAALPWLKKAKGADIVNLGSRSGRYAFSGGSGYNTTKFGLQGFSEALFLDLNKFDIRVSLVAPGVVSTGFGGTTPEPWHLTPADIARVVVDVIGTDFRAAMNWVEIRPAKPQ
jgi:3-oxoacyl-[acyl-carrier protein] reductase